MNTFYLALLMMGAWSTASYALDHEQQRGRLRADDKGEHEEQAEIYVGRGLDPELAKQVADQLMVRDAIVAHARDELGITENLELVPFRLRLRRPPASPLGEPCHSSSLHWPLSQA